MAMNTMHIRRDLTRAGVVIAALSLLASPVARLVSAQAPAKAAAGKPAASTAAAAPVDGGWPRASTTPSGAGLVVYQPQISSWPDQKNVVLYAAVSYTPKGAAKPALGTVKVESATNVAPDRRLVSFSEFRITESNFSTLQRDQVQTLLAELAAAVPLTERVIALDRVLANLDKSQIIPKNVEGVKADPPPIFFSKTPAVLMNVDGDPIWSPIKGNDLQYAVNTNWDLFQHTPSNTLYLRANDTWLKAAALQGPWTYAGPLPDSFYKLPDDPNWKDAKGALPGKKIAPADAPRVFATTTPAELILLKGEPWYSPVAGTAGLLWVGNTESDLFRVNRTGPVYFLTSGRWFSAPDFSGPWTFASPNLPPDFKKIPLEHSRSRVLASVPGTPEAAEAVLLAQIPQTATVGKDLKAPEVSYQGTPEFQPIEKTTVQRAVNTDKDIIKVGDLYYMCFQGVWFMSKSATGPWEVTGAVPEAIYTIPVSSPSYSVTYVTVQTASPTTVVYAASPAYSGMMVAWGCAVWGTGYYYPPYVYRGAYPIYYPHYPTYGYAAAYNPWTGTYARGAVAYGPYGGAGYAAAYNPRTGTYARGAVAYGPYGAAGAAQAYNPRTGAYRPDAAGGEPVRQLGLDQCCARRSMGQHAADHQQRHRRDHPHHAVERGLVGEGHRTGRQHGGGGQEQQRRSLRRPRRQCLQEGLERRLSEVRQRQLELRAAADPGAEAAGAVPGQLPRGRRKCQLSDDESGPERRGGAHSGRAAHEYLQPRRRRQQLSPQRWWWRRPAKVRDPNHDHGPAGADDHAGAGLHVAHLVFAEVRDAMRKSVSHRCSRR